MKVSSCDHIQKIQQQNASDKFQSYGKVLLMYANRLCVRDCKGCEERASAQCNGAPERSAALKSPTVTPAKARADGHAKKNTTTI